MNGKVALITGGAGGIGSAICKKLAERGASVIITYNSRPEKAQALCAQLPGQGHSIVHAPVHDSAALQKLSAFIAETYGALHLLVNNAGITTPVAHDDLDGLSDEWIDKIFTTNVRGSFAMIRACRDLLQKSGNGLVVNISSVAAVTGIGSNVAYCASKAAIDSMTRSLARALAPRIRVVSVSPGWVLGEYTSTVDPAYLQTQLNATPLNRLATPEDVADAVHAVAAHLTFSTGCIIPVDGGRPLK